ncbi:hypothetical protein GPAL_1245 [Glaciecola pallidula DSM 14239 = ACAM 615]|uniref:Uncharacterized protein n=1 Tax=Brumicola pallidula DSM 14239 = ACAM 615 TaxID=1121922 RepID=K6ZGS2_9ALTE|nr:hypothetical protein GPAL_1245 [Glaciecola pallidula DSM 14239 = ACAM 615]
MVAATAVNDSFCWWQLIAIVGALVLLCLSPYLIFIGTLIYV